MSNERVFVDMFTIGLVSHERIDNLTKYPLHCLTIPCCVQNHLTKPLDKPPARTPSFKPVDNLGITCG